MLTVAFDRFGGPDVLYLIDRDIPTPGAGEVVVKVIASTVAPTDIVMRDGRQASLMRDLEPPYVAGTEFAGFVYRLGDEADSGLGIGTPVMGIVNARRRGGGAQAEYVCVPAASVVPVSPDIDLAAAATVPMNGMTAKLALETLGLPIGSSVLVTGGAGALGGYVIELAKHAGLMVVADAKESDVQLLRRFGADFIVPRGDAMAPTIRRLFPQGVDGLIDAALLGDRATSVVRESGPALTLRRSHPITDSRVRACYINVFDRDRDNAALAFLARLLRDGKITPRVGAYPNFCV